MQIGQKSKFFFPKTILIVFTVLLFFIDPNNVSYKIVCILSWIDVGLTVLVFFCEEKVSLKNAKFLFLCITILFTMGQNLAYLFIADPSEFGHRLIANNYSDLELCKGSFFVLEAFNLFVLGLTSNKHLRFVVKNKSYGYKKDYSDFGFAWSAYYIGTILLIICAVPQIEYLFLEIKTFLNNGYGQTAIDGLSGMARRLHYLFLPAVCVRYCGKKFLKKRASTEICIVFLHILAFLAIGDRGSGLSLFVTLLWLTALFDENFKIRKYLVPVVLVIITVPLIKYYRISFTNGGSDSFVDLIEYTINNNPITDILVEMGGSQEIIILTMKRVQSEGIAYGVAYLDFFIKQIPSFLGIDQNYGTLAKWVIGTTAYQTKGFSIWAEAFLNFGILGSVFMYIPGCLFKKIYTTEAPLNVITVCRTSIAMVFFLDISRRSISEFGYNFLYDFIVPLIVIYLLAKHISRKRQEHE